MDLPAVPKWFRFRRGKEFMQGVVIPEIEQIDPFLADRMKHCGDIVNVLRCMGCGTSYFAGFTRCKSRYCVNCARVIALLYFKQIMEIMNKENIRYAYLLTLTIRDMVDLREMVNRMVKYWKVFYNGNGNRKYFKDRFMGWFKTIEVKKGKFSCNWHVHIHVLLVSREYGRDYEILKEKWKDITNGEGSVYIQVVKKLEKGVLEVVKYILKPGIYTREEWKEILLSLRNVKQVSSAGIFKGIRQRVEKEFDTVEEELLLNFVCRVCNCSIADLEHYFYKNMDNVFLYDLGYNRGGKGDERSIEIVSGKCCSGKGGSTKRSMVKSEVDCGIRREKSFGSGYGCIESVACSGEGEGSKGSSCKNEVKMIIDRRKGKGYNFVKGW